MLTDDERHALEATARKDRDALQAAHLEATARMEAESARLAIARDRGAADYRTECLDARDAARRAVAQTAAALAAWDAQHDLTTADAL